MTPRYIDYGIYGDGDVYDSDFGVPVNYVANYEASDHYLSFRLKYTADIVPGGTEAFRLHNAVARLAPDRQGRFTHDAFVDRVQFTGHISTVLKYTGSEIILSHIQLIAQRKKHQPLN